MKRLIYILLSAITFPSIADNAVPTAYLKAQYNAWHSISKENGEKPSLKEETYILQIGHGESCYYNRQTYYVDSLINDPNGKLIYDQAWNDALQDFTNSGTNIFRTLEDKGLMGESSYKNKKSFKDNRIVVYDRNGDNYRYDVDMSDLSWELCDSTAVVLNYECNLARADYHGRQWTAWFAPDIPVQDGPWQLCGLPGLVMKAETDDGAYGFVITGLQQCDEPFKVTEMDPNNLFITKRKSFLKMKDYRRRNRSSQIKAMTNGKVNVPESANYKGKDDYLETDYHD